MKTTRIFCLLIVLFSCSASLVFAVANPEYLPVDGSKTQPLTLEKMPDQITMMQQNIKSMNSLLMQMSSVLQKNNLTEKQEIETEKIEPEWNYWDSDSFESH